MDEFAYSNIYQKALKRAAKWHRDHTKKGSAIPYVSHLLTVSALVWEDGGSETEAIAALLHDAVEDGKATLVTIEDKFGADVARIVHDCSDATPAEGEEKQPWFGRKVQHIGHLRDVAASEHAESTFRVVAADKLANVRSILVDHRGGAPDLWDRFNGGLGGTAWYYGEMSRLVGDVLPDSMLARELALAVASLETVRAAADLGGAHDRIAAELGPSVVRDGIDATAYLAFELARVSHDRSDERQTNLTAVLEKWLGPMASQPSTYSEGLVDRITAAREDQST